MRLGAGGKGWGVRDGGRGFTLVEMLVYLSVWLVVVGLGFTLYYRGMVATKRLGRSGDDLVQAVQAGERWRGDLRGAEMGPTKEGSLAEGGEILRWRAGGREIAYRFTGTNVLRRDDLGRPWVEVVRRAASSEMVRTEEGGVESWKWELELRLEEPPASLRPLFSFQAVRKGVGTR